MIEAEHQPSEPATQMMQMITGYWITQLVHGAAASSLADHLRRGPMTAEAMARAENLEPSAAFRFLRACAAIGLVKTNREGEFTSTALLDTLRSDNPHSLRGLAIALAAPGHWLPWGRVPDVLRTGKSQAVEAIGDTIFDYYAKTPDEEKAFSEAMSGMTAAVSAEVVRLLDTANVRHVVDIGGAEGALLFALLKAHPALSGTVFDVPTVANRFGQVAKSAGLADRATSVGGDFFNGVPEADLYLMKYILHDWNDDECLTILKNCRRSLRPGGRIAIIELVLGEVGEPGPAPLMDINMLVMASGRERTFAEYESLLTTAGFTGTTVTPTATPMVIIEARGD